MSSRTRKYNCQHVPVHGYTDIPLLMVCCAIARMLRILLSIVVPHDEELKYRILYEAHDTALSGHLGREKTYGSVSQIYWWPKLYKCVCPHV